MQEVRFWFKNARTAGDANATFGDVQRHRPIGVRSYAFVTQERLCGARNRMLNVGPMI